jgi:cyclopropane-fatty-acyl-phospholipid synthase
MSSALPLPVPASAEAPAPSAEPGVAACYSVFDSIFPACGFTDLTDGMYEGDPARPYEAAQVRQAEVLLDRAGVGRGSRLLDVGCGYGRILKAAEARGAAAWGITISREQVRRDRAMGLHVRQVDYRHLGEEWNGRFDAVIANGSLEHFVQAADAAAGLDNMIYRRMFVIVRRLLDPTRPGRFVTTAIHFRGTRPDPHNLMRPSPGSPSGSAAFHWSRLVRSYGGWYPVRGQLEECAGGLFRLVHEEDGTEDYRRTSEAWLAGVRGRLWSPRVWLAVLRSMTRRPIHTVRMLRCVLGSESWNWQFRGDPPPTTLLRQVWDRVG